MGLWPLLPPKYEKSGWGVNAPGAAPRRRAPNGAPPREREVSCAAPAWRRRRTRRRLCAARGVRGTVFSAERQRRALRSQHVENIAHTRQKFGPLALLPSVALG